MKILKVVVIALAVYVGIIVAFESLIGILQPQPGSTLVITTLGEDGDPHDRVVSHLALDDRLYVAANHWPRAWYERALERPTVEVSLDGEARPYRAVPVTDAERARLEDEHGLPLVFRVLTGFPPRHFLRLDPEGGDPSGGSATGAAQPRGLEKRTA